MGIALILLALLVLFVIVMLAKTVRIVPQARAGIVERFGKYKGTLPAGLNILMPFIDRLRYLIDLREQVVSFPPQPVITEDNLVVSIDTVRFSSVITGCGGNETTCSRRSMSGALSLIHI